MRFLKSLYEKGSSYSLINAARSAISKYHLGFNGTPAGQHTLVCQAVKAVFRLNPPLPKYQSTYDIQLVFTHIKSLQPSLTLKELTYKTLFLLTASSISRMSSVSVLGPKLLVYKVSWSPPICTIFMIPFFRIIVLYQSSGWRKLRGRATYEDISASKLFQKTLVSAQ